MSRYKCTLDSETLAKAVAELNEPETNEKRLEVIDSFRDSLKNLYPSIQLEQEDDYFILSFLRAKKFRNEKAIAAIKYYHEKDSEYPEIFEKTKYPKALEQSFDAGIVCPIKGKAKDGSSVVMFRVGINDCPLSDVFCLLFLTFKNMVLGEERNQIYGFTIIYDLTYFGASFAKKFDTNIGKVIAKTFSKYLPIRIKQLNFTNQPRIFSLMFGLVTSFVDSKSMKAPINRHGNDFTQLHQSIDKTLLPKFVGGNGPELSPAYWKNKILK